MAIAGFWLITPLQPAQSCLCVITATAVSGGLSLLVPLPHDLAPDPVHALMWRQQDRFSPSRDRAHEPVRVMHETGFQLQPGPWLAWHKGWLGWHKTGIQQTAPRR